MAARPAPPGLASGSARRDARYTGAPTRNTFLASSTGGWDGIEVVPDSEEERMREDADIIEISSDEEESSKPSGHLEDPASKVPGAWPGDANPSKNPSPSKSVRKLPQTGTPTSAKKKAVPQPPGTSTSSKKAVPQPPGTPTSSKKKAVPQPPGAPTSSKKKSQPSKRPQIAESTSADAAEDQIVVPEWPTPRSKVLAKHFYGNKTGPPRAPSPQKSAVRLDNAAEESDSEIEVLSGPTPSPGPTQPKSKSKAKLQPLYDDDSGSETSNSSSSEESSTPDHDSDAPVCDVVDKYVKYWTRSAATGTPTARKVNTPSRASSSSKLSLAARLKLELQERAAHRVEYAEQVYSYLNHVVFKNQLPSLANIDIKWNSRLLTTAGRAHFHRDRNGKEFVEIHLATKVVDTDERIRNTLSHEMCHLACWIIDKEIKEAHGKIFNKWSKRVERKDSNITISIQHTYEISYNYEWECGNCDQTIGRYTNSIDTTRTKCPRCKTGTLTPLFDPKDAVSKISRQAAAKPQSSPRPGPRSASPIYISIDSSDEDEEPPASIHVQKEIYVVHDSDSESDDKEKSITDLARKFEGITIGHKVCLHAKRATRARR
ncbi:SprT-like family-domain-containing protein [Mycena leptocephala]|nr:SprT-like family-domain-containing protein [Mycena leptocephala]